MAADLSLQLEQQFADSTECPICNDEFEDPKFLPCHHTFCRQCLDSYCTSLAQPLHFSDHERMATVTNIPCPICRRWFQNPGQSCRGFPDDFKTKELIAIKKTAIAQSGSSAKRCNICSHRPGIQTESFALWECAECEPEKMFCLDCGEQHRREQVNHRLVALNKRNCNEHPNRQLNYYCENCQLAGCTTCRINVHQHHDVVDLVIVGDRFRKKLEDQVSAAKVMMAELEKIPETVERAKVELKKQTNRAKKQIDETAERRRTLVECLTEELQEDLAKAKKRRLSEVDNESETSERKRAKLQSFVENSEKLAKEGKPAELLHAYQDLPFEEMSTPSPRCVNANDRMIEFSASDLNILLLKRHQNLLGSLIIDNDSQGAEPESVEGSVVEADLHYATVITSWHKLRATNVPKELEIAACSLFEKLRSRSHMQEGCIRNGYTILFPILIIAFFIYKYVL